MSAHYHAVVWIDHREARVFHFNASHADKLVLHPDHPTRHLHHKANCIGSGHAAEDHDFLQRVAQSVADAGVILITGPAQVLRGRIGLQAGSPYVPGQRKNGIAQAHRATQAGPCTSGRGGGDGRSSK